MRLFMAWTTTYLAMERIDGAPGLERLSFLAGEIHDCRRPKAARKVASLKDPALRQLRVYMNEYNVGCHD